MKHSKSVRAALLSASLLVPAVSWTGAHAQTHSSIPQGGTVIAAEADISESLNPHLNQQLSTVDIDSAVFDGLVKIGDKGQFLPDLASSWTVSANGLNWVFKLNPKATWQDGVPFTADDVVYTTNLVNNPVFGATSSLGYDHIKTIKAVGKYEVDITLKKAYAPFLQDYATGFMLPKHVLGSIAPSKIRNDAAYNQRPLGTGPFEISEYVSGDHVTLVPYKGYFLGTAHLDKLIFRIVPSAATAVNQMEAGEINLAGQTADLSGRQWQTLTHVPGLKGYNTPGFNWTHIDLIQTGFFKDVKVRQALQTATNRPRIIQVAALGYGTPQYSDQPPAKSVYNKAVESYWPYSLTKAASMLAADGFKKGSGGTLTKNGTPLNITLWISSAAQGPADIAQILKQDWGQIGVGVTIKALDSATLFGQRGPLYDTNRFNTSAMNAVLYEWIEPADPNDSFFWSTDQIVTKANPAGGNFDGYSNPVADKLMAQGLVTTDQAQRKNIYMKLQTILANDVPDIWLYWGRVLTVATSKLHNYDPNPFNYDTAWNAKDWYIQ